MSLERHAIGQWFTPPAVADLALALALSRCAAEPRIIDPTCGDGVFLDRARAAGVAAHRLCGVDIDARAAAQAQARVPGARILRGDVFHTALEPFDAVVGNPPYVRQERLSAADKQRVRQALARDWPAARAADLERLTGRADLAAACILRALALARPGARVALVVSSALLDAGYAAALWRTVALGGRVAAIVDAPGERWFADAAVNTSILVLERSGEAPSSRPPDVRLARLRVPTRDAVRHLRGARAPDGPDVFDALDRVADVRRAPADQPGSWASRLRAPPVWFEVEARARGALVPLGEVAEVRRGVTSGANEVFYLHRDRARALAIEPEVLVPLLRSPRDHGRIHIDPQETTHLALVCPADADLARYPGAQAYVRDHRAVAQRRSLRARRPWWALPVKPARLFLTKAYGSRFVQRLAGAPMVADQRVYAVHPRPGIDVRLLAGILNSTYAAFALESLGRASMGEGALEWTVKDAAALPVIDPRQLDADAAGAVIAALDALSRRPIEAIDGERDRADRRALDETVAAAQPALAALLDRIWPALIDAVRSRNQRRSRALA